MSDRRKCCVPGCSGDVGTFHNLPKEPKSQRSWLMFVYQKIPEKFNPQLCVCSAHFTPDCFSNFGQFQQGFAQRLTLKRGALPTKLAPPPSASQQAPSRADEGCHCNDVNVASQRTWLCSKKLEPLQQSKGTTEPSLHGSVSSTPVRSSRPAKRPRLELEEEEEDVSAAGSDPGESTYNPADSTPASSYGGKKFIVFEQCLISLFESCPVCTRACNVQPRRRGSFIAIHQICPHCGFFRQWRSQPVIGSTPVGNLQLSAAIYFCGASFVKMKKVFDAMQLRTHTYDAFRRHARTFIEPAIIHKWKDCQRKQLDSLREADHVVLGGDMRADSKGHSEMYGSYSMMDMKTKKIIDIQLVQSNDVGGGSHMEKEGLKRSLDLLQRHRVKFDCFVTKRRPWVQKFLKDQKITHYYDLQHTAKGLSKKLEQIGKDKDCSLVSRWQRSIINHLYWSITTSVSGTEKVAKWTSILNHIQDIHNHSDPTFPECVHQSKVSKDRSKWFQPGSSALNRLNKVLLKKSFLADVEQLSPHYQTSTLEAFHSVILQFAPKHLVFDFVEMLCRLYLAAMYFNEKRTGCVSELMHLLFNEVVRDPSPYVDAVQQIYVTQDDRPAGSCA